MIFMSLDWRLLASTNNLRIPKYTKQVCNLGLMLFKLFHNCWVKGNWPVGTQMLAWDRKLTPERRDWATVTLMTSDGSLWCTLSHYNNTLGYSFHYIQMFQISFYDDVRNKIHLLWLCSLQTEFILRRRPL